ncbi:MAG: hypothetical protein ABSC46_02345 [Candidatus Limnocylindrales bacterium]|jgi:hypothetical protein
MPQFYYQEAALLPAAAGDCVEAARRTLAEMGAKPVVAGYRTTGRLGSQLKMRIVGGVFCPNRWLPIEVVVDVMEAGGQRQVVASVAEKLGVGFMIGMEKKYRAHCQQTATYVRDSIAHRLAVGR